MLREQAELKDRIEREYRVKAEAEAREKIEAEMRMEDERRERESANSIHSGSGRGSMSGSSRRMDVNGIGGDSGSGGKGGRNGIDSGSTSTLPLASPGASTDDGTDGHRLSDGYGAPPFTEGRMLDETEAEEMCSAITKLNLESDPKGGSGSPYVLFHVVLKTNRRRWSIDRRYSDFVWLHQVWSEGGGS